MAEWVSGKVINVVHCAGSLYSIKVTAPVDPFLPGQYAKLALKINEKRIQRAYSYVNAPSDDNLEFYLIDVPQGELSPHLCRLSAGAALMVSKQAAGFFVLKEIPQCDTLWMLATGTGIGPYLSILQEKKDLERFKHLVLVHSVRLGCDLSYLPLMQRLEEEYNGKLRTCALVSREKFVGSLHGRIPALIENDALEKAVGLKIAAKDSHVMLCGNPQMVRDTQQMLQDIRQMKKYLRSSKVGHISSEQYW
ncbi:ferredoxin--NADP(+) reductase [Candidatus Fukatsuia symbiotica]|uniref:Flavodoxin/ferredoxin--NADP reductase n=1 Tax=Candidatus Fukatsuia symbiotica TaxID=1878942 RepID=A0A2U8I4B2_9GAMM|nr:ferredoxin--NADP(+) reductase [Candidatus Fukatsuia symbiotica]AWK13973.1 ferredoxin--NADP(+) reductase [Candidatus Fukatsuia symbiotica]MEA9445684.1 ferredoxin--NADP(+) reductase [Candidatus Fukatsuia symbiotica]